MLKVVNERPHEKGDLINQYLRLHCTCAVRFMLFILPIHGRIGKPVFTYTAQSYEIYCGNKNNFTKL